MLSWEERPIEIANLLNPAFCSLLLGEAIAGFEEKSPNGMSYILTFLILPIVLHKSSRDLLPRSTRTRMFSWLQRHPEVRVGFAERVRDLVPYTKESIMFAIARELLDVDTDGNLNCVDKQRVPWDRGTEPESCQKGAKLLGRWFALSGEAKTIFTMWGIRP